MVLQQRSTGLIVDSPPVPGPPGPMARMEDIFIDGRTLGYAAPDDSQTTLRTTGIYDSQEFDASSSSNLDDGGRFLLQNTSTLLNSVAGADVASAAADMPHSRELNFETLQKFSIEQNVNTRFWAALIDTSGFSTSILMTDTPVLQYVGLRFSTSVPDTNFRFMSSDGITTNNVDTGIFVSANDIFYFKVQADDTVPNFILTLFSNEFVQLATTTFAVNIPAQSTPLNPGVGITNLLGGATRSLKQYVWAGVNKIGGI